MGLLDAEDWVIAQVRGNTDVSDDKCIHLVIDHLEEHFGWSISKGSAFRRLQALTDRSDDLGERGRAVCLGLWLIRDNPDDIDELNAWKWISEARAGSN